MLRKGVRTNQTDLRRLFDTLKSLRNQRTAITELPTPRTRANEGTRATVLEGDKKEWDSIEAMEAADVIDDNEPRIRVFRQTIKPPELLKQPLESLSETPILDAATSKVDKCTELPFSFSSKCYEGDILLARKI